MRVAETALHSYRTQPKGAADKAALLLQAVKLLSLLSKCAMPNGGDVSALFEEHMRNAANRRYRTLKQDLQPPILGQKLAFLGQKPLEILEVQRLSRVHVSGCTAWAMWQPQHAVLAWPLSKTSKTSTHTTCCM